MVLLLLVPLLYCMNTLVNAGDIGKHDTELSAEGAMPALLSCNEDQVQGQPHFVWILWPEVQSG